jgi:hypothetical protein
VEKPDENESAKTKPEIPVDPPNEDEKSESKHRAIENWMKGHMDQVILNFLLKRNFDLNKIKSFIILTFYRHHF